MTNRKLLAAPHGFNSMAVLPALAGVLAGVACTADWLADPLVSGLLWPADISVWLTRLLGGTPPAGTTPAQLSVLAVAARLTGLIMLLLAVSRLFHRDQPVSETTVRLILRMGVIGMAAGVVWAIQQFLTNQFAMLMLPPLLLLLLGAGLWSCLVACFGPLPDSVRSGNRWTWNLMLLMTVGWIGTSFHLNERLYANLLIPHGDSAMYEEHLWNVWHGKGFRSYLDQGLFLGEHIQVIHLLLLPAHMLWPSHLTLELAESVALGSCTIPLYLIVRHHTNSPWAACLLAISWLFYFPMHFLDIAIDQKSFRPVCLGLPCLFWMIYSAESSRFRLAWLFLILSLSAKEDMALITAPVGAVMAVRAWRAPAQRSGLRHWGIAAAAFSAAWLLLAVLIVIPAFRSGDVVHYSRYFGDLGSSPTELIHTALTRPGLVLSQLFSMRTLLYACLFLAPVAGTPLRSPVTLLAGLLTFLMLSLLQLSNGPDGGGLPPVPYHHFHAPLLPVLFWAAASGLAVFANQDPPDERLLPNSPQGAALLVLCCCITTGLSGSLLPFGAGFWSGTSGFGRQALFYPLPDEPSGQRLIERAAMAARVTDQIPPSARVAATDFIHTRLTHCERSYDYSGYERTVNEEGQRVPADTEYIVIDTGHRYSTIRSPDDVPELQEPTDWELLPDTTNGHFLILQRHLPTATRPD